MTAIIEIGPISDPIGWINKISNYPRLRDAQIRLSAGGGYITLSGQIEGIEPFRVEGFTSAESSFAYTGDLLELEDAVGWAWGFSKKEEEEE